MKKDWHDIILNILLVTGLMGAAFFHGRRYELLNGTDTKQWDGLLKEANKAQAGWQKCIDERTVEPTPISKDYCYKNLKRTDYGWSADIFPCEVKK